MARGCCSKTAAERELYRYYQPNLPAKLVDKNGVPITRPSVDACMTAFAQLGALRLNASRGIISLAVKETEYILAEAGKTLTLQEDDDEQDSLWHGFGELEKGKGLGPELVQHFRDHPEDSYLVIKDLKDHPTLKHKKVVDETSRVRFLACVPLRAPFKSTVIGNFIVIDGEPRDGLSEDELQYLIDLGTTVMEYLESGRAKQKQDRAERLVKALGLFVEGKATLRDWWLGGGHNYQASKIKRAAKYGITLESRADFEFGVQDPENVHLVQGIESLNQRRPRLRNTDSSISSTLPPASIQSEKEPSVFESTANTTVESEGIDHDIHSDSSSDEIPKNLQEALVSSDVKNVFARASNLIREATALEGVVFYDASVGTFGGRVKRDIAEDKAPGGFIVADVDTSTSSEENLKHTSPGPDGAVQPHSLLQHTQDAEKACNILGYSTRRRSSLKAHIPSNELRGFPEKMMRRLLKKYPHGKVFNFDEHGSFSSDSEGATTEAEGQQSPTPEAKVRRTKVRMSKEAEAAAILSVLPGARSVFWFPLWDQAKERWFAGSLVWSVVPTRALCPVEDLTYMAAFGNSVMAEVSRLSALAAAQMKSDFISSISHELRSPLHGVLASVEFLQETQMTDMQTDMVNNISASGKVLLDTINHVLDFSNVNKRMKRRPKKFRRKGRRPSKEPSRERKDPEATEDAEDICVMSDEVVNSVYAGRNVGRLAQEVSADRRSRPGSVGAIQPQSPVTVIMDISYRPQWMFEIDAGAWRRILMNLFSNAIKYTDTGFVKVTLNIEDEPSSLGQRPHSSLFLKVSDSGKGISQEFLKHHLFKPFSQEDSLAVGTGLGLSIVRQIVHEIGGEIYFTSEQGTGTEAMVRIPLTPSNSSLTNDGPESVVEVRKVTNGLKASFVGFDRYPEISETPTGILSADSEAAMILRSSVKSTMHNWFGIQETTNAAADHLADLEIIMEAGIDAQTLNENLSALRNARAGIRTMAIVLCSKFIPRPHNDSKDFKVVYLQQPYGPLKYVKALYDGFCKDESIEIVNSTTNNAEVIPANGNFTTSQRLLKDSILDENSVPEPKSLPSVCTQPRSTNGLTVGNVKKPLANGVNNMQGMRVLLVEDNVINLKLLVTYMRKLNIDHATAMNGLEALNAYKDAHGKFDIVFMDISMPVMSGIESTRHIRGFEEEKSLKPVALIALTGAANPAARQEAYASGIDLFLTKPVPMKALKKMLEDFKTSGREALSTNDD